MTKDQTRGKGRDIVGENGDYLSKMPTATAEQLNIARILVKQDDEMNLRQFVIQVITYYFDNIFLQLQELTECTEDQAVTALYDCENDLERAVELLLDKFRCGVEEEWHTSTKKGKSKQVAQTVSLKKHLIHLHRKRLNKFRIIPNVKSIRFKLLKRTLLIQMEIPIWKLLFQTSDQ